MQLMWNTWVDEPLVGETPDPLGLHAAEVAVADALVPGFSGSTEHARSLALRLGGLLLVEPLGEARPLCFERFDRMCVHAFALDEPADRFLSVEGILAARRAKAERDGRVAIDLEAPLTSGPGPAAGYRRLAVVLGWVAVDEAGEEVPTARGRALGRAALAGVDEEVARSALQRGRIAPHLLQGLGLIRPCNPAERKVIRAALAAFEEGALVRLVQSAAGFAGGDLRGLAEAQRELVEAARLLAKGVQAVENPFREAVGRPDPPVLRAPQQIESTLAQVKTILARRVPEARLPGLDGLVRAVAGGRFADLLAHHRRLMAARGVPPWEWARRPRVVADALPAVQARLEALWTMAAQVGLT